MKRARATNVRAMHTCVGSDEYFFMYLSVITAPRQETKTLAKDIETPTT